MKKRSRVRRFARFVMRGGRRRKGPAGLLQHSPQWVVFDFDGTIADTFLEGFRILNTLAEEFGFQKLPMDELDGARDFSTRDLIKKLGIPKMKLHRISKRGTELMTDHISEIKPCAGMLDLVRDLHQRGYRLGILTSNSETNVSAFLKKNDIEVFEFIKSSSKLLGKSSVIRHILKDRKLQPNDILFVGDEIRDIEAAQETGIHMAAVTWGYNSPTVIKASTPDYLFDAPQQIADLLVDFPAVTKAN